MNNVKRGKGPLYIAFAMVTALAVPLVSALRTRISGGTIDLLSGVLIGCAFTFLAAATYSFMKPTSRRQT